MTPARLLLVDDNPDNLEILTVMLSETYSVSSHGSPAEALAALETVRPDLLVLDIGMRPLDGIECLEAIRSRPGCSRIPAIALTAFALDDERRRFRAAGFQAVITKPILDPQRELIAVVDAVLKPPAARAIRVAGGRRGTGGSGSPPTLLAS